MRTAPSVAAITGGTLHFGAGGGDIYTGGDLQLGSSLAGSGGLVKSGPGTLMLAGSAGYSGGTLVSEGVLKVGPGNPLSGQSVVAAPGATLDVSSHPTAIGAVNASSLILGSSTLTVGALGFDSTFGGITGSGQIVLQEGGNPAATHLFNENSGFSGTVRLDAGRLQVATPSAFGSGTLVVRGGALGTETPFLIAPNVVLETDLRIRGGTALGVGPGTVITGARDVIVTGSGGLSITGPVALAGRLRAEGGPGNDFTLSPGTIAIRRAAGSLSAPQGVQIASEGKLALEYGSTYTGAPNARLDDATPVLLRGSTLALASVTEFFAPTPVNAIEIVGPITGAGRAVLSLGTNGVTAQLTAASIDRSERGTFLFTSSNGAYGGAPGANGSQFQIPAPPELVGGGGMGVETSILPWAAGTQPSGATGLVTCAPDGIRMLIASEYTTSLATASATSNVAIGANVPTNDATLTINSLTLRGSMLGTGTLNITSGAVLVETGSSFPALVRNNLAFSEREAIFHFPKASTSGVAIADTISGTGGLTISGSSTSTLELRGNNTFTGPITVNGGKVVFSSLANLGAGAEPIALHGHSASLSYGGTETLALGRELHLRGGVSRLEAASPRPCWMSPTGSAERAAYGLRGSAL